MEDLEKRREVYGIYGECNEPAGTGEYWCRPCNAKRLKKNLKIGLVKTRIFMNSYKIHNLMLCIIQSVLNGYLLKIFKMLLMLPEEVLVKFIQLNGLKDIFGIGILKINRGEFQIEKLH